MSKNNANCTEPDLYSVLVKSINYQRKMLKEIEDLRESNKIATEKAMHRLKDLPNSNQPEPEVMSWARLFFQW